MPASLVTVAYLAAGLLFILSLAACPRRRRHAAGTCTASSGCRSRSSRPRLAAGRSNYPLLAAMIAAGGGIGALWRRACR